MELRCIKASRLEPARRQRRGRAAVLRGGAVRMGSIAAHTASPASAATAAAAAAAVLPAQMWWYVSSAHTVLFVCACAGRVRLPFGRVCPTSGKEGEGQGHGSSGCACGAFALSIHIMLIAV